MSTTGSPQGAPIDFGQGNGAGAGAGPSPQYTPPNEVQAAERILNPGGSQGGTPGEPLRMGTAGLGNGPVLGLTQLRSTAADPVTDGFTVLVGEGVPVRSAPGSTVPANAALAVTVSAISPIGPGTDQYELQLECSYTGDQPGNNEAFTFPVFLADGPGATVADNHFEFVGHVEIVGPQA